MKGKKILAACVSVTLMFSVFFMLPVTTSGDEPVPALLGSGFTVLLDFENGEDDVTAAFSDDGSGFSQRASNNHTSDGQYSAEIYSDTALGWGNQTYINIGNKLGAADAANMTYIGFHIKAAKGAPNGSRDPNAFLLQDVQMSSAGAWYSLKGSSTYYMLADGDTVWTQDIADGSSVILGSEFSGYVAFPLDAFKCGDTIMNPKEFLSDKWGSYFSFHVNKAGGEYGSIFIDTFFYSKHDTFPPVSADFPYGTLLRDFEKGKSDIITVFADDGSGFNKRISKSHTGDGLYAAELYSETALGWGNQTYMKLGTALGATNAVNMKYIGFHIKAGLGADNGSRDPLAFLLQDVQISSAGSWYSLQKNTVYYLLADGTDEWTTDITDNTSTILPSEYSGFIAFPIRGFKSGLNVFDPAEDLSAEWDTYLSFHVNKAGGEYGSMFLDSIFYSVGDSFPPKSDTMAYGTMLLDFEGGENDVTAAFADDSSGFSQRLSTEHASSGLFSAEIYSDEALGWGNQTFINIGNGLGATDAVNMTYIGFHIKAAQGAANDVEDGAFLLQNIQISSAGKWYSLKSGADYELLADGETVWTAHKTSGSSTVLPGSFSGYLRFQVPQFMSDGIALVPSDVLSDVWGTFFSFHVNKAGGEYGSMYVDSFFYSTQDIPVIVIPADPDPVVYDVDYNEIDMFNGTGEQVPSQEVYVLLDFENGQADVDTALAENSADSLYEASASKRYTGNGIYSMKLSSKDVLTYENGYIFMAIGNKLGLDENALSMKYIGFHIKTSNGSDFKIQDVQLTSEGKFPMVVGGSTFYTLEDGADKWMTGKTVKTSTNLNSNWSGIVVYPVSSFYLDGGPVVLSDFFSTQWNSYLMMHFNESGGELGSIFIDTIFYSTSDTFDKSAVQLTSGGKYLMGVPNAPASGQLTSLAESKSILSISGCKIFARENTVSGLRSLLSAPDGMTIKFFKGDEEASEDDDLAIGMTVKVFSGDTLVSVYVISTVNETISARLACQISPLDTSEKSKLLMDDINIKCWDLTVEEILANIIYPFSKQVAVLKNGVVQSPKTIVTEGMVIRCFDPDDETLFFDYPITEVIVIDTTNGYVLGYDSDKISIDGKVITVLSRLTAAELIALMTYESPDDMGYVEDEDGLGVDDDSVVETGMVFLVLNDIYEEIARWQIVSLYDGASENEEPKPADNPKTSDMSNVPILLLLLGAAALTVIAKRKRTA